MYIRISVVSISLSVNMFYWCVIICIYEVWCGISVHLYNMYPLSNVPDGCVPFLQKVFWRRSSFWWWFCGHRGSSDDLPQSGGKEELGGNAPCFGGFSSRRCGNAHPFSRARGLCRWPTQPQQVERWSWWPGVPASAEVQGLWKQRIHAGKSCLPLPCRLLGDHKA